MTDVPIVFVKNVLHCDKVIWNDNRPTRDDLPAGSASWIGSAGGNEHAVLDFMCPCGCGTIHAISVSKGVKEHQAWKWDGNIDKPTLEPSIQCLSPCHWHGYLIDGIFKRVN